MAQETIGTAVYKIKLDYSEAEKKAQEAGKTISNAIEKSTNSGEKDATRLSKAWTASTALIATAVSKAFSKVSSLISNNISNAVSRIDTLNAFPKVMNNLGIESEKASKVINELGQKLKGLPTTLDAAALAVQRFTSKNGDVEKSEEIFLAVNNAILAGGASADIQASALEQLSQAYAKGKPDMMEWRSLQIAMPAQLKQVATAMLGNSDALDDYMAKALEYATNNPMSSLASELLEGLESIRDGTGDLSTVLGQLLRAGIIPMDEFTNAIIRMNNEGIDGFSNFEQQARDATGGIGTTVANLNSAVTRAITKIIEAIGNDNIINAITGLGNFLEDLGTKFGELILFVQENEWAMGILVGTLSTMAGIIATMKIVSFSKNVAQLGEDLLGAAGKAKNFIGIITTGVGNIVKGIVTGFVPALSSIWSTLTTSVIPAIFSFTAALLTNPITWIVVGILALIAAITLLIMNFDKVKEVVGAVFGWVGNFIGGVVENIKGFFQGAWEFITGIFSGIGEWFGRVFQGAFDAITGVFNGIGNFFQGVWNTIVGIFTGIGKVVGEAVSGAFKTVVNGVLGFIEGFINGPINVLNGFIGVINGAFGWAGVNLDKIKNVQLPRMYTGGIVPATAGGMPIIAGDGGEDEWVVPESKMASLIDQINTGNANDTGNTYNIYVNGVFATSPEARREVADQIVEAIEANNRRRFKPA